MDFFVSADLTPQNQWQLELMIESFKTIGLEDKLLVCVASENDPKILPEFSSNMRGHARTLVHRNIGAARGFEPLNKLYAVSFAMKDKVLSEKFVMLDLDTIIFSNPQDVQEQVFCRFQIDPYFTPELIEEKTGVKEHFGVDPKDLPSDKWPSAYGSMVFGGFPSEFFDETINLCERYVFNQIKSGKTPWSESVTAAINMQLHKYVGKYSAIGTYELDCDLFSNHPKNFINYRNGYMPVFSKSMFEFKPPSYFSFGNPFKVLSEYSPTMAFMRASNVAKSYLERTKLHAQDDKNRQGNQVQA